MRHKVKTRTLGRKGSHRLSLIKNLLLSLLQHRRIETTHARAKEVAKLAEKMITLAKKGNLSSKREVFKYLHNREVAKDLFEVIAPSYKNPGGSKARSGGYTRIIKAGFRRGDSAPVVILELV